MRKTYRYALFMLIAGLLSLAATAQVVTITGNIRNGNSKEALPSVSVTIKGSSAGTYTDNKGNFKLITTQHPPFTIVISSVGFEAKEVPVTASGSIPSIDLAPTSALGSEVVVSANRVPERILESPVTIERISAATIRNSASPSYYDIIRNLNGVDVTTASLTFNSVTTRGFNGSGNLRFNQFVDGMDNQAPGLNFSVGSVIGLTELDVDNMELLSGASSALYGSGGMNGTLLINSKDPFKYQGLSVQVKQGIMHTNKSSDPQSASPYYDWSFRWGVKINEKFAFKLGAQFIQAKDWQANDSTDYTGAGTLGSTKPGTRATDPNYNGVNLYGDETSVNIYPFIPVAYRPLLPAGTTSLYVSRTGYRESQIIDNTTVSVKLTGGLYYKITPGVEASLTANYGTGNTVYTGSDRYSLKDLKVGQYKLEFKGDNWFVRSYTTRENSGEAFNATVTAQLFNEAWSPSSTWYNTYAGAMLASLGGGASFQAANQAARAAADVNRPATAIGNPLFDAVRSKPIPQGGLFLDRTNLYHTEGQYDFSKCIKIFDLIAGGSWRQYILNSQGTLFADSAGRIHTNEYGAYAQASKRLLNNMLKLTASVRYDKNENFKGKFTPRFTAVVTVAKDQDIRASYQNAYRFPSNQNQWINLNTGAGILIGGLPQLRSFYHFDTNPVYNASTFLPQTFGTYKPESVNSYELGYKGLFSQRLLIDLYGYYSRYKDFIGRVSVVQSKSGNPATINPADPTSYTGFSVSVNSANTVNSYGAGLSVNYMLPKHYGLTFNLSTDNIDNPDPTFATYWNTPKYRTNLGINNTGFGFEKRFGFCAQYRWQDKYYTQADFKQGNVSAFSTIDAMLSYKLTHVNSLVKIGATNLLNHYYTTAFGNPAIGAVYYVSYGFNVF